MLNDIYLMNKSTGELVPSQQVFKEFYKTHNIFDSVFNEWQETNLIVDNSYISPPDFTKAIKL
jgi:hypothetical protein